MGKSHFKIEVHPHTYIHMVKNDKQLTYIDTDMELMKPGVLRNYTLRVNVSILSCLWVFFFVIRQSFVLVSFGGICGFF